jgi:hypothetical protein
MAGKSVRKEKKNVSPGQICQSAGWHYLAWLQIKVLTHMKAKNHASLDWRGDRMKSYELV